MKVHKIVLMVLDFEEMGAEETAHILKNVKYVNPSVMSVETKDCGEWSDDHPLNILTKQKEEFDRLFSE